MRLLLDALPDLPRGGRWCEPCCGDGSIVAAVEEALGPGRTWTAIELEPEHAAFMRRHLPRDARVIVGDAREELPHLPRQDVAITNAPFPLAVEIATAMLACAAWVALLQRLDWMEGSRRRPFWTGPGRGCSLFVLPDRPRFLGRQDSGGYAWYVWHPDRTARPPVWLPSVPLAQRQEHRHQLALLT